MLNRLQEIKNRKSSQDGFTIIEVMVVLAIAGLILVIVLFAVPALQRNSRNTALKSDASQVLGYVNDNVANNDGAKVTGVSTAADGTVTVVGASTSTGKIRSGTTATSDSFTANKANPISTGSVTVFLGETCGSTSGATYTEPATGSTRAAAVVYAVESQSGDQAKCIGG